MLLFHASFICLSLYHENLIEFFSASEFRSVNELKVLQSLASSAFPAFPAQLTGKGMLITCSMEVSLKSYSYEMTFYLKNEMKPQNLK